ncbi:MAG: three-Cys-motif partner protein TcmP [Planctomycetes bacterium]|nr:three-Cys-motif partner protein TcmP [Planctomycetota bacterium]
MFQLPPPKDDGLYIPTVGQHSKAKHYFLTRYIDAFTTAMKDKWGELHYIDLFAGAGIEKLRDSKELNWGSPMIAAQARFPFNRLHLCEKSKRKFDALKSRIQEKHPNPQVLHGDANIGIHEIVSDIGQNSLSLAFLDPYGLHLAYETLRSLSAVRTDLIIFFPDHLDALRNWEHNYLDNPNSNLDRCLGPGADWRSLLDKTPAEYRAERLRNLYVSQLKAHSGYSYFEYERISHKKHPLYILILCGRHKLAAELWRKIAEKKPDGQRTFPFD